MHVRGIVVVTAIALSALSARAAISIEWVEVDNSSVLSGYKTFDLFATTDFGWCCNAMLFTLDTGTFFQHPQGGVAKPPALLISAYPDIEFDTYLAAGEDLARLVGAAGDVGGDVLRFDDVELDVTWAAQTIPVPLPSGRLHMARLTFSDDASGDWRLAIAASERTGLVAFSGTVADIVPEPALAAWVLMACGLLSGRSVGVGSRTTHAKRLTDRD